MPSAAAIALLALLVAAPAGARDNILVFVADDLGVDGVGVYSRDDLYGHPGEGASPGPTPNIDQLAAEGVLFRNATANPLCAPTRAAALTGRAAFRTGIGVPGGAVLDLAETTLAEVLGPTHATAAVGKWHLGASGDVDHPIDSGFDHYAGALAAVGDYTSWDKTTNSTTTAGSTIPGYPVYATTDNADEAIARIAEFGESPWFVWLAFSAPHAPFHVPPAGLVTIAVDELSDDATKFRAAVEAMDTEIGRVLASIPPGVLADTTIVFLGDNGTPRRVSEPPFAPGHAKGTLYEGGTNVPLIVRSPRVPAAARGSESPALVVVTDLFATLAGIAGAAASAEDSVSFLPNLVDPTLPGRRRCARAERFQPNGFGPYTDEQRAARDDRYKLTWRNGVYEELYDLAADPFEQANLLPVAGLDPAQRAAYDSLVLALETAGCGPAAAAVPVSSPAGAAALAGALAALALRASRRRRCG